MDSVNIKLSIGREIVLPVHPVFGDDVKLKISQADNQVFYRTKIDGKIIFSGADFDLIDTCSDEVEFTISVFRGNTLIGEGKFIKPDCVLNYDDKTCEVKLSTTDRYEKIMAGLDNKYNLVKLAPKIESLLLVKRPVLQLYMFGDKRLTNFFGNMSFEVDTINEAESKTPAQLEALAFARVYSYSSVKLAISGIPNECLNAAEIIPFHGTYRGSSSTGTVSVYYKDGDSSRTLRATTDPLGHASFALYYNGKVVVAKYNNGVEQLYTCTINQDTIIGNGVVSEWHNNVGHTSEHRGRTISNNRTIFARLLCDEQKTISGYTTKDITTLNGDIYENGGNYRYVISAAWLNVNNYIQVSTEKTTTPTEYYDGNGEYYVVPSDISADSEIYPIGTTLWTQMSFWIVGSSNLYDGMDSNLATNFTLKDAFPLYSAIQVLLAEIAPDVTYDPTLAVHEFFRENYTLRSLRTMPSAYIPSPRSRGARLYITPITNVKKTRYEQAAQRGDMTLKQIFDMLRNVYDCYWWIDDDNRLRIEHVSYFKHNNAYLIGKPKADIDVTAMKDMPNGLSWAFGTSEVEYDRKRCPVRYEFEWGDVCTEQFNGAAIDIEDKFVDGDAKEKVNVANFMADIDFIVISPRTVSDDLYVLIESNVARGGTEIPMVSIASDKPKYAIQNGYCSFLFAEANYLNYDLGGWRAKADGAYLDVRGVRQYRKQTITFPMPIAKIADIGAVKTDVGIGRIKEQEINADTLMAKSQITLEGEKDYTSDIDVYEQGSGPDGTYIYVARNKNPHNYLQVTYYGKDSVTPSPQNANAIHSVTVAPKGSITLGHYYFVKVLSTKLAGVLQFDEFVNLGIGVMTLDDFSPRPNGADFVLNGHGYTSAYDWCYICVTCQKRARITLSASTETDSDKGYVAHKPLVSDILIRVASLVFVSGTSQAQYVAEEGEVVYIGYTKDISLVENDDKITVGIEVLE